MTSRQPAGRSSLDLRPISLETGFTAYAEGSVLIKAGNTHVLCNASIEESVPSWLKGLGQGWVTAEYSMLPRSTHIRTRRDREKVSGRTQEIQRLIGRSLRSMVNLNALGERSILIDCDVLQADGGTRTAAITGGCVALAIALHRLEQEGLLTGKAWMDTVAAVSIGLKEGQPLVDLDYAEDSSCDVDMNLVITGTGNIVEVQGTAERKAFSKKELDQMLDAGQVAIDGLKTIQLNTLKKLGIERKNPRDH